MILYFKESEYRDEVKRRHAVLQWQDGHLAYFDHSGNELRYPIVTGYAGSFLVKTQANADKLIMETKQLLEKDKAVETA